MAEVVALREDSTLHHGEPDQDVIEALSRLLEDARSGYLRAVDYVAIDADRGIATGWAGRPDGHDEMAGVNMLAARVMALWLDGLDG